MERQLDCHIDDKICMVSDFRDMDDEVLYGSNFSVNLDKAKPGTSIDNNMNVMQLMPFISKKVHSPNLNHRQEIKGNESKFEPRVLLSDHQCHNFRYGIQ